MEADVSISIDKATSTVSTPDRVLLARGHWRKDMGITISSNDIGNSRFLPYPESVVTTCVPNVMHKVRQQNQALIDRYARRSRTTKVQKHNLYQSTPSSFCYHHA